MDGKNPEVNVEKIMGEIRSGLGEGKAEDLDIDRVMREIVEEAGKLPQEEIPSFESVPMEPSGFTGLSADRKLGPAAGMAAETDYLRAAAVNPYYRDIGKGAKGFLKDGIRRVIKGIVFPISEQQSHFNQHVVKEFEYVQMLEEEVRELREQVDLLRRKDPAPEDTSDGSSVSRQERR